MSKLHESLTLLDRTQGVKFVFGSDWIAVGHGKRGADQAVQTARKQGATHISWRRQNDQAGITRLRGDRSFTSPRSAAAVLADLPQPSVLAAFLIGKGSHIWIFAAEGGAIYPQGDRVYTDEVEARAHFESLFNKLGYWELVLAPESWGDIKNASGRARTPQQVDLNAILRGEHSASPPVGPMAQLLRRTRLDRVLKQIGLGRLPGSRVEPVPRRGKSNMALYLGAGAALAATAGLIYYQAHPKHTRQKAIAINYPLVPNARQLLQQCVDGIDSVVLGQQVPGWKMITVTCTADQIKADYEAQPFTPLSTLSSFLPQAILDGHTRSAHMIWALPVAIDQESLHGPFYADAWYTDRFGRVQEAINAQLINVPNDHPQMARDGKSILYREWTWGVDTAAPPSLWQSHLLDMPNLTVTAIVLSLSGQGSGQAKGQAGLKWTLKGAFYAA